MKRLITICAVVGLMLSLTSVSWAVVSEPNVKPPPDAPKWWNGQCDYYAYGWWENDLVPPTESVSSPPADVNHWASNFLTHDQFKASIATVQDTNIITIGLDNVYRADYNKEIYIALYGTTTQTTGQILAILDTDGGTFSGDLLQQISEGKWAAVVKGEISPQPDFVKLQINVPGLTRVTNIWAGENCLQIPEPTTIALLGFGTLSLLRRKRSV